MSGMGINDFLDKLGHDTISQINKERKKYLKNSPEREIQKEEKEIEMPKPQKRREKDPEPIQEEQDTAERLDEEFIEKAIDYADIVVKTVRKSFNSVAERKKVFESIQSAIDVYLGAYGQTRQSKKQSLSPSFFDTSSQPTMKESDWNNMPQNSQAPVQGNVKMNDLTGQQITYDRSKSQGMSDKLNIKVHTDATGKKHADLSSLTEGDVSDLQVLAGIKEAPKE